MRILPVALVVACRLSPAIKLSVNSAPIVIVKYKNMNNGGNINTDCRYSGDDKTETDSLLNLIIP